MRVHGFTAPSANVRRGFGITKSGSSTNLSPSPVHSAQAPDGLLKLNKRGSGIGRLILQVGQLKLCESRSSSPVSSRTIKINPFPSSSAFFNRGTSEGLSTCSPCPISAMRSEEHTSELQS